MSPLSRTSLALVFSFLPLTGCGGSDQLDPIATGGSDAGVQDVISSDSSGNDVSTQPDSDRSDVAASDVSVPDSTALDSSSDAPPSDSSVEDVVADVVVDAFAADVSPPDAGPQCPTTSSCPAAPGGYSSSDGLYSIDPCAFPMRDDDSWSARSALIAEIAKVAGSTDVGGVLAHTNRYGKTVSVASLTGGKQPYIEGVKWAFQWNHGDENVAYWIPQGLTGSTDAYSSGTVGGKRAALVTWYYDKNKDDNSPGEKGIRIALADITDPKNVSYRLVLLVDPYEKNGRADLRAIDIHAGGAAWVGRYLYVADTTRGFRVFDMERILEMDTSENRLGYDVDSDVYHAYRYRYVIPQVGFYRQKSACSPRFSFVALDRSSHPPALVSGEYSSNTITGRLFRWPIDLKTGKLPSGEFYPSEAFFLGKRQVQGAVSYGTTTYLSSSQPPSGHGDMTGTTVGHVLLSGPWVDGPEDLVFDTARGQLWGAGEATGKRYVFAVDVSKL